MDELLLVNPRRRKRHAKRSRSHRRSRAGGFRVRRRRMRNPRGLGLPSVRGVMGDIVPAAIGASGAIGLDVLMAYLPLPDMLKSGWGKNLGLLAGALALGFVGSRVPFIGRRNAQIMTLGALTVVAYNVIKPLAAQTLGDRVKGLQGLADFGDYSSNGMGAYMNPAPALLPSAARSPIAAGQQMGAYMNPQLGAFRDSSQSYF